MNDGYILCSVLIMAALTALTRFFPFLVFSRRVPSWVEYLGKVLPFAVIGMLVVYCFRNISVTGYPFGIPELIAVAAVIVLHVWKRSTLLSVFAGTALYMVLLQLVFV